MAAFRDMEEVSQGLLSLLGANRAEAQLRQLLGRHERMVGRLLETQDEAEQRLRDLRALEMEAAQNLLAAKERARLADSELQELEAELRGASQEDEGLRASLGQLGLQLQELRAAQAELEHDEQEVDRTTTISIPAAVYVAQLYRRISKIEWDYENDPGTIRGIHHGPSVAQPISLDASQLSKKFISDYLWALVDTEW
ncbi:kinetochore protein Spc24 [Erinaceus europaeus]|uniref:Kinetochore protein Spc24 n=1 Tax=Erinaceus europaeus TaxID=9365 RepID=A0A1S2ZX95_ERIEU|nr:kinetochore protein Spc24 [Erinaceus europaeus]